MTAVQLRKIFTGSLLLCAALFSAVPGYTQAQTRALDQVVAVVNNEAITLSEYAARHQREFLGGEQEVKTPYQAGVVDSEVLQRMLDDRIIIQAAKQRGLTASDAEVAQAVQNVADSNKVSVAELYSKITEDGLSSADFRESMREQILRRRMIDLQINSKIEISDADVEEFLAKQDIQIQAPVEDSYEILHVLFATDGKTDETIAVMRTKISQLLAQVNSLEDFATLANEYSAASNGEDGGYLGWRSSAQLPKIFVDVVKNMQVGSISELFASENGLHVLFLKDKQSQALAQKVVQENISHVLIRGAGYKGRSDKEAQALAEKVSQLIKNGQSFASMARIYSEDPRTNEKNGLIGWVDETQMSRSILDEVARIQINDVTQPVQSAAGWHIIQLNDRRELSAQEILINNRGRSLLFREKAGEQFEQWFNELKKSAFVEIVGAR